jgi:hypothetical protein
MVEPQSASAILVDHSKIEKNRAVRRRRRTREFFCSFPSPFLLASL